MMLTSRSTLLAVVAVVALWGSLQVHATETDGLIDAMMAAKEGEMEAVAVVGDEHPHKKGPACKSGNYCPMENGICCDGGSFCCPAGTKCSGKNKCRKGGLTAALDTAKRLMQEEGKKQIKDEQKAKGKTEKGQKARAEEKSKNRKERQSKRTAARKESANKAKRRAAELKVKKDKNSKERNTKKIEKRRKDASRQKERRQKASQKTLERRKKALEKRKKKARAAVEKSRKAGRTAAEKRTKAHERSRKSLEKSKKAAQEKRRKNEVKIIRSGVFKPRRNQIVAPASTVRYTGAYTYMFWVRPEHKQSSWANMLYKGANHHQRNPAIWFYPRSTRIHFRSGITRGNWNYGLDPHQQLPLWTWTHVTVQHRKGLIRIYYNARLKGQMTAPLPTMNNGAPLYSSDPWHQVARASMADLRYMPRIASTTEIRGRYRFRPANGIKPVVIRARPYHVRRNMRIASGSRIPQPNGGYSWTMWFKVHTLTNGWCSFLHKGHSNHQRNIGMWLYPHSYRVHIRSGINHGSWNWGHDPGQRMVRNHWTHIAVIHYKRNYRVYYNGRLVAHQAINHAPRRNNGPVYSGDPWHHACPAMMSDVRYYYQRPLKTSEVVAIRNQRKYT